MKRNAIITACWICVIAFAAFLRFDDLASRPFHCDEATGARITARRMETGTSQFDPQHFHGPILGNLAIPLCRLSGEFTWPELTKRTLRLLPAAVGTLLVLLPLCLRRRFGDSPMLLAAALLACSPLLVYYSRMYIHEMLLGCFGVAALVAVFAAPRQGFPGFFIGLMFAAKESFAISILAWLGAGLVLALLHRRALMDVGISTLWRAWRWPVLRSGFAAALTAGYFYTDGFRHPQGAWDAVRTFFVYQTTDGHDKSFFYYLELLTVPMRSAGRWWFGTPVVILAVFAVVRLWLPGAVGGRARLPLQFIALATLGHLLIYSLLPYKTPWLMVLPWAHLCILAGFGLTGWTALRAWQQAVLATLVAGALLTQTQQTRLATGRLASDERNPFAYVPTIRNIESLEPWLHQLALKQSNLSVEPIAVIGMGYWPLPWYLRSFKTIGYWPGPPAGMTDFPLVFAADESADTCRAMLAASHTAVPRGLRANVTVTLFIRNDLWRAWMQADPP